MRRGSRTEDLELIARLVAVRQVWRGQRPRRADLGQQQSDPSGFVTLAVGSAGHRRFEQLADDALVYLRVLAQIERRQVEAENPSRAPQLSQAAARQQRRTIGDQRAVQDVELAGVFTGVGVGRRFAHGMPLRFDAVETARGRCQARVDAGQRASVRFVAARGGSIG